MSSAWNWLGIFVWLIIIAYFLFIIHNAHSRKKTLIKVAMSNKKHGLTSNIAKNNFEITLFEVLILVVLLIGMGKTTRRHHITSANSVITAQVHSMTESHTKLNPKHPNQKIHHYYVMVSKSKARDFKQNYFYAVNGKKLRANSGSSLLISSTRQLKNNPNLAHEVQEVLKRKSVRKKLNQNKPVVLHIITAFKNTASNGIGLHAGQHKFFFNVIKVPSKTKNGIYVNNKKLAKKAKKTVPKG